MDNKRGFSEKYKCFVVMPYGIKPFRDGTDRTYDFDKVYRVIIQRAIRQAEMEPIRADETKGSRMIHSDMFKDLRDQPVIVADLSLENPNVYYELGIRHVMSNSGTVLMCQKGSDLPFDIQLSRTIFYEYDGKNLDWEEVERVVKELEFSLREAKRGEPDSPVRALLETVLRDDQMSENNDSNFINHSNILDLVEYQKIIASHWDQNDLSIDQLFEKEHDTIFGSRVLGYYCLNQDHFPEKSIQIARHLSDVEQYELANAIFKKIHTEGNLDYEDILRYASSYSEEHLSLAGVNTALEIADQALNMVINRFGESGSNSDLAAIEAYAQNFRRIAGLQQWKWQLTEDENDLETTIQQFLDAIKYMELTLSAGKSKFIGLLAQAHLKVLILLRIQENNIGRNDSERHADAILNLKPNRDDDPDDISYLNWYQAISLADSGAVEASRKKALETFSKDGRLINNPLYPGIGKRQYVQLRRFLEQYSSVLRNPSLIGGIAQILQVQHKLDSMLST